MPITYTKTRRRYDDRIKSIDPNGFVINDNVVEVYTAKTSYKAFIRPKSNPPNEVNPLPHWFCMVCNTEYAGMVGSILGKIFKGYRIYKDGKTFLVDTLLPGATGSKEYKKGRICSDCSKRFKTTGSTPLLGEVQLLRDPVQITPHPTITPRIIDIEDTDKEHLDAQTKADQAGFLQRGRIKVPLGTGKYANVKKQDEPVHLNAFRAFMRNRTGKNTGGRRLYDPEVNFDNQKKG